jgi:hypothetical protein
VKVYLFESGTHVLWAEEVARDKGILLEVIPAPPGFSDHCALAIRTPVGVAPALEACLVEEGIVFRLLP